MSELRPKSHSSAPPNWMEVARLLRPQGRRGELLAEPAGDLELFVPGRSFALGQNQHGPGTSGTLLELESAWQPTGRNAGRLVLKLRGTDSISDAEALTGQYLFLSTNELPALEEGVYRVRDLTGCSLFDGERIVGTITDLQFPVGPDGRTRLVEAPDLLVVEPLHTPGEATVEPVLVPFVRAWLLEVDLAAGRLRMQLPPGLFDAGE